MSHSRKLEKIGDPKPMSLSREFLVAWRRWRRAEVPTPQYRSGAKRATTYEIEANIDHIRSSVTTLVDALMIGRPWDYARRANEELADLELTRFLVEQQFGGSSDAYGEYIELTERLLRELAAAAPRLPDG